MKKRWIFFVIGFLCFFTLIGFFGCRRKTESFSKALIVLPGAQSVRFLKTKWSTEQLSYRLEVKSPAAEVISAITSGLEKQGWIPQKEDFLNPGIPTSLVKDWSSFIDRTAKGDRNVKQWMADWKNSKGDIVRYALRYDSMSDEPENDGNFLVVGIFIPADEIKKMNAYFKEHPELGKTGY